MDDIICKNLFLFIGFNVNFNIGKCYPLWSHCCHHFCVVIVRPLCVVIQKLLQQDETSLPPLISRLPPMFLLLFLTGSNISLAWTKYLKDIFFANSSHSSISLSMEYLLDQISTHIVLWSKQHWLSICGYINIIYSSIEYLSVNIEYWGKHSTDCQYLEMHQRQIDRKWFHLHAAQTGGK